MKKVLFTSKLKKKTSPNFIIGLLSVILVVSVILNLALAESKSNDAEEEKSQPVETVLNGYPAVEELETKYVTGCELNYVDCDLSYELQNYTYYLCDDVFDLDFYTVMAIMYAESDFQEDAVSMTDDYGLMQINSSNKTWMEEAIGVDDLMDPYQNIYAGCFILRSLIDRCKGEQTEALMAYNLGYSGAEKLWKQGITATTYSDTVYECYLEIINELTYNPD